MYSKIMTVNDTVFIITVELDKSKEKKIDGKSFHRITARSTDNKFQSVVNSETANLKATLVAVEISCRNFINKIKAETYIESLMNDLGYENAQHLATN